MGEKIMAEDQEQNSTDPLEAPLTQADMDLIREELEDFKKEMEDIRERNIRQNM